MPPGRPDISEYPPRYVRYIALVPEEDICSAMEQQLRDTLAYLRRIPESAVGWRYAPEKWTVREVVGHIVDTERIYGFRLLAFARGDVTRLARADQDLYVRHGRFGSYPLSEALDEYFHVRSSHVVLVRHLPLDAWRRTGTVSDFTISVRALAYVMVGHERHHLGILQERYLKAGGVGTNDFQR